MKSIFRNRYRRIELIIKGYFLDDKAIFLLCCCVNVMVFLNINVDFFPFEVSFLSIKRLQKTIIVKKVDHNCVFQYF